MDGTQQHWGRDVALDADRFSSFWKVAIKDKTLREVRCAKTLEQAITRFIKNIPDYVPLYPVKLTSDIKYKIISGKKKMIPFDICAAIYDLSMIDVTKDRLFAVAAPKLVAFECVTKFGNRGQRKVVLKELSVLSDQMPFRDVEGNFIGRIHVGVRQGQLRVVSNGLKTHDGSFEDVPSYRHSSEQCNFNLTLFGRKDLNWKLQPNDPKECITGNLLNVVLADLYGEPADEDIVQVRANVFDLETKFEELDGEVQFSEGQKNLLDFVVKAMIKRSDEEVVLANCDLREEKDAD